MDEKRNIIKTRRYDSPCGALILGSFDHRLCLCDWLQEHHDQKGLHKEKHRTKVDQRLTKFLQADFKEETSEVIEKAIAQLDEYFSGHRRVFNIPLLFAGTDFQQTVWNELLQIPYGTTVSYGELAQRIGQIKAVRAVAQAVGANSISIFAPCHRVVGSNHSLTGYAGGLNAKRMLLKQEGLLY